MRVQNGRGMHCSKLQFPVVLECFKIVYGQVCQCLLVAIGRSLSEESFALGAGLEDTIMTSSAWFSLGGAGCEVSVMVFQVDVIAALQHYCLWITF